MTSRWIRFLSVLTMAALGSGLTDALGASQGMVAGIVIVVKGKPMVGRPGKSDRALKRNEKVYEGDVIKTGRKDKVAIAFIGGAEARIAANSTFTVESGGGQKPTSLRTTLGQVWTRLLHGHAGLDIHTPAAVAAVRGTEADVEAAERTTVKVYEGLVDVYNDQGKQPLTAGQMTQAASGQAPETPRTMSSEDKGSWQDALSLSDAEKKKVVEKLKVLELELPGGKKATFELEKK